MLKVKSKLSCFGHKDKVKDAFSGQLAKIWKAQSGFEWTLPSSRPLGKQGRKNISVTKVYGDISVSKKVKEDK